MTSRRIISEAADCEKHQEAYWYWRNRAESAEREVQRLREALEAVREDIEVCNWKCARCGADPEMPASDLASTVYRALGESR